MEASQAAKSAVGAGSNNDVAAETIDKAAQEAPKLLGDVGQGLIYLGFAAWSAANAYVKFRSAFGK
jgi:hypothetical protein